MVRLSIRSGETTTGKAKSRLLKPAPIPLPTVCVKCKCYAESHHAEWHYAECRYHEGQNSECHHSVSFGWML
jgi:hypothetical protein